MATRPNRPLLAIVGPTASGKTSLAVTLAKQFNGKIICADSRTVYKGMDIGTAKPAVPEQQGIPHYLLDIVEPGQPFTVADFKHQAEAAIRDIQSQGKLPVLVGGSGLYIDSVLFDYDFNGSLTERDSQNPRHLSSEAPKQKAELRANTLVLGLEVSPELLEQRIRRRIEAMFEAGIADEAQRLGQKYGWEIEAMKTYLPLREYLDGVETKEQAIEKMVIKDRRLAKKQRTWFKRNISIQAVTDLSKAVDLTTTFLNTHPTEGSEQKS